MKTQKAYFAAGCFWEPQHLFSQIKGVVKTQVGYCGGHVENPDYQQVCTGTTGHCETVEVIFDPQQASYENMLDCFWKMHDPTQADRQGPDIGTQYRSAIFTTDSQQNAAAKTSKDNWEKQHLGQTAVTKIEPVDTFYKAEQYHQNYLCKKRSNLS